MGNQARKVQKVNGFGTEIVRIGRSCTPFHPPAMVRATCGAKLMEKKSTAEDLMEMLGLKETVVHMAKANGVRWYASGEGEQECSGFEKEDALNRVRWRVGVGEIAVTVG